MSLSRRRRERQPIVARTLLALAVTLTGLPIGSSAAAADPKPVINPEVVSGLAADGTTSFWVYLRQRADLSAAAKVADKRARTTQTFSALTTTADTSQKSLRAMLDSRKASYKSYWIANAVRVTGDKALLDSIAKRSDVERVEPTRTYRAPAPVSKSAAAAKAATTWGVSDIGAPAVWDEYADRGEGIVVANIDTGVDIAHPALASHYRGHRTDGTVDNSYNWFDGTGTCPDAATPCDDGEHGTHTMGTMVGDDGAGDHIGVAPGATFIAAKGCEIEFCADAALLAAGQWILAPTDSSGKNPRPDLRPDVVNNSWGGGGGDLWYQETIRAWVAAGIFPAFAAGNAPEGASCNSIADPGSYPESYAVGAYSADHAIAGFSLRGKSPIDDSIKPDIAAPGVAVRSAVPGGGYATWDGTSMATPHVAGAVALIWAASPLLRGDVAATRALLDNSAVDTADLSCGGTADDNNTFGEGRLDVHAAVAAAPKTYATVSGLLTAGGKPAADAKVTIGDHTFTTAADGRYRLIVEPGTRTLTVEKYGYATAHTTVTVADRQSVTRDVKLTKATMVPVRGKVTDGSGHRWPLYAKLSVAGRPGGPVYTDPDTGAYSFDVPAGTSWAITTTAVYAGYRTSTVRVAAGRHGTTADVALTTGPACDAAGYTGADSADYYAQTFDTAAKPAGWTLADRTGGGGWTFDNPAGRDNQTGGTGGFAIIDSDHLGGGHTQDADLVMPPLDLSKASAPYLRFSSDYWVVGGAADVDVSADGGASWTNVWHTEEDRRGPRSEQISLDPVAGVAGALVRFRFQEEYGWWWQIDDVRVLNRACTPVPGGLVIGTTRDANTKAGLAGVAVTAVGQPAAGATSIATPDDPNEPDGLYWLFSPTTRKRTLTAAKRAYATHTATTTVAANTVNRKDQALDAGRLKVTPAKIDLRVPYGSTRTATITVTNAGKAPATVMTVERSKGYEELARKAKSGPAAVTVPVKGLSQSWKGTPGVPATTPQAAASAWVKAPDIPGMINDNAAVTADGTVYSLGGQVGTGYGKSAYAFDIAAQTWKVLPDLPRPRARGAAVALGGKIYLFGGWSGQGPTVPEVDVYDPRSGTWSTLSATNPSPVASAGVAVSGGKVYLVGGCVTTSCVASDTTVVFDAATGKFSTGTAYPHAVAWTHCGALGRLVFCAGGSNKKIYYKDLQVLNTATGVWTAGEDMTHAVYGAQTTMAGGLLVIAGGVIDGNGVGSQVVGYDPVAGAWIDLPAMPTPRYRAAAACGAYIVGGTASRDIGSESMLFLDGLGDCGEQGDATWMSSQQPDTFTLAPGKSRTIKVTLTATAAAGVTRTGTYSAQEILLADTPYAAPVVPVTMTVTRR
ncbi:S8 family serine peptidase [Micromonospora sp. ALFpr18c]|nr:S8 family serine peptidase [Micromonospora sp. ALFpr18c]KAB1934436.1 S8 family serine peptidase [Micromonospora sp. ALFpr18c]